MAETAVCALYLRISQDRDGTLLGVDRQREDCERLAARNGWTVGEVFVDDDLSAYSGKPRPAYERLLAAVEAGQVRAVVAWHPDRLHRSPVELERFIDLVTRTGCQIATCQAGELDLSTASGRMTARVVGAVARHESEQKSERIRRQRAQAARQGLPHGGRRAFGYQPGGILLDPVESVLVREAANRVLAGESAWAVAQDWNRRDIRPVYAAQWRPRTLTVMLTSPRLAGLRTHLGEIVAEGVWAPIITRQEHEQLVALLSVKVPQGRKPVSLLNGLLVCGRCGGRLTHSNRQSRGRVYVCLSGPGRQNCGRTVIVAAPVELGIVRAVQECAEQAPPVTPAGALAVSTVPLEARRKQALEMLAAGEMTRGEWLQVRDLLDRQLADIHRLTTTNLDQARRNQHVGPGVLADQWETMSVGQRRTVLALFVHRVTVGPGESGKFRFPLDRLTIEWAL